MEYATSYGLAFSSGVNAYLPLLSFSIAARWFHLYTINPNFSYVTQDWFMIALTILALADIFADKIPYVDHVWDLVHTVLRPIAGAIVAAASESHVSGAGLIVPLVVGGGLAGMVHTTKSVTRVASTASTAGFFNIVLSIFEDIGAVVAILLSLFAPAVMAFVVVLFIIIFIFSLRSVIRVFKRRKQKAQAKMLKSSSA